MKLPSQKRIAAAVLGISRKRVKFDPERLSEIKEAITKADIRTLINDGAIHKINKKGISRGRARKIKLQKRKGRRRNEGSLKGSRRARLTGKEEWINRVRLQRGFLMLLKKKGVLSSNNYRLLRQKIKGGFFRSLRHLKLFIEEYNLTKKNER